MNPAAAPGPEALPSPPSPRPLQLLGRLLRHAQDRPGTPAYRLPAGAALSYRDLAGGVCALAAVLRRELPPGAVVLLSCANRLEYPIAFLAILAAGHTVFPVSAEAAEVELSRAACESRAAAVIGHERAIDLFRGSLPLVLPIEQVAPGRVLESSHAGSFGPGSATLVSTAPGQSNLLLQSSGTTGLPKIVRRTGPSLDSEALAVAESVGFTPADRVLMTIPLTHSYGLEHGLLAPVWGGSAVILCRGLDPAVVLPELTSGNATILPGVPSTFEMLATAGSSAESHTPVPALRRAYSAGGPLPRPVFDAFLARFGARVTQLYGASEVGSVTFNRPDDLPGPGGAFDPFDPASVGLPMRDVSVRILSTDGSNQPLPAGEEGQVAIRAASMFAGYLQGPAGLIDGHFPTGDLGRLDARGRLFLTGRIKLLIDVGGLKVNPLEVEAVLGDHPAVGDCVVVPVRQSQTVYRLKAIVTPRDPAQPVPVDELRALARSRLSAYKVPRLFEVRQSLPRSATGKLLRHLIDLAEPGSPAGSVQRKTTP